MRPLEHGIIGRSIGLDPCLPRLEAQQLPERSGDPFAAVVSLTIGAADVWINHRVAPAPAAAHVDVRAAQAALHPLFLDDNAGGRFPAR